MSVWETSKNHLEEEKANLENDLEEYLDLVKGIRRRIVNIVLYVQ